MKHKIKSINLKAVCKAFLMACYCALICAAVLFSFTSVSSLTPENAAGTQTLKALGAQTDIQTANRENDINLLARFISAEARRETYAAQVAVGSVILNRVKHAAFPNSISAVIYQPGAFASIKNGRFDRPVSESAFRAARDALNNIDPSGGAVYFYNPRGIYAQWLRSRPVISVIGSYIFC